MAKASTKLRVEIAKLQEQLRQAEAREAERIGKIALKAGLGELVVPDADLQRAFEELAGRFRKGAGSRPANPTPAAGATAQG